MEEKSKMLNFKNLGGMIFLVIIAFGFIAGGFQNQFFTSIGHVATVGGEGIPARDFQNAVQARVNQFASFMGGTPLTQEQIEQFQIRQSVLSSLIDQQLLLNLASDIELEVSTEEISDAIRETSYFQTKDKKFSAGLYRSLLQQNGLTPKDYEKKIAEGLKAQKLQEILTNQPLPKSYGQDRKRFNNLKANVSLVSIKRDILQQNLTVSKEEASKFQANPSNEKAIENRYEQNKKLYFIPEEVEASHILVKEKEKALKLKESLNPKNFAKIAGQNTEDPSGKKSGGTLGRFGRGKMVPAFDEKVFSMSEGEISEPVKSRFGYHLIYLKKKFPARTKSLAEVKSSVTEELVRESKSKEIQAIMDEKTAQSLQALKQNNDSLFQKTLEKEGVEFVKDQEVGPYTKRVGQIEITPEEAILLTQKQSNEVLTLRKGKDIVLARVGPLKVAADTKAPEQKSVPAENYAQTFQQELQKNLIEMLKKKTDVEINSQYL